MKYTPQDPFSNAEMFKAKAERMEFRGLLIGFFGLVALLLFTTYFN